MHRGVKLRHVRAFLDAAEDGSVSAAARRLGLSQPALSKTIAELEAMIGARLLVRAGRGVALTPEGRSFRRHALDAMQKLESAAEAARPNRAGGPVSVGLLPTAATRFFPDAALAFARRRPECRVTVRTGSHLALLRQLRDGEIDLMIGRMPKPEEIPGLGFEWLYNEEVVLAARRDHPYAGESAARAARACGLILPTQEAIIRPTVDGFLAACGVTEPKTRFETVSLAFGAGLLERSDLVWFISRGVIEREIERGYLVTLPLGGAPFMTGALGLTRIEAEAPRPEVADLMATLREAAAARGRAGA